MARSGLGWRAQDLADRAGVGYATVARFEAGSTIADESRDKLRAAMEAAGAKFSRRSDAVGVTVASRTSSFASQVDRMPDGPEKEARRKQVVDLQEAGQAVGKVKKLICDTKKGGVRPPSP